MARGPVSPVAIQQFFDANGHPLAGGQLFAYLAGTSTPAAVYSDAALLLAHPNPLVLDAAGRAPLIFLGLQSYKFVLMSADSAVIWTADDIADVITTEIQHSTLADRALTADYALNSDRLDGFDSSEFLLRSEYVPGGGPGGVVTIPAGSIGSAPTGLGPADAGALYMVLAPYFHMVRWSGTQWQFAPGDSGNGHLAFRPIPPQAPGWQLCDGTVTDYLVTGVTLSVAAFTTPNLAGTAAYLKAAATYDPTIYPPVGDVGGAVGGETSPAGGAGAGTTGPGGAHSHGGTTHSDGTHIHTGGWTEEGGAHAHTVLQFDTVNNSGPVSNTDAGTSFFSSRGDHVHTILAHPTDVAGNHFHNLAQAGLGDSAHYHGIDPAADHTHAVTIPDHTHTMAAHTHTVDGVEPSRLVVPCYFRR